MKVLLIIMIAFSLFFGITINGQKNILYIYEFNSNFEMLKAGTLSSLNIILWCMLLITHSVILSLPFLTRKQYFKKLMIGAPLIFVVLYTIPSPLYILLLLPFIFTWIICLIVYFKMSKKAPLF